MANNKPEIIFIVGRKACGKTYYLIHDIMANEDYKNLDVYDRNYEYHHYKAKINKKVTLHIPFNKKSKEIEVQPIEEFLKIKTDIVFIESTDLYHKEDTDLTTFAKALKKGKAKKIYVTIQSLSDFVHVAFYSGFSKVIYFKNHHSAKRTKQYLQTLSEATKNAYSDNQYKINYKQIWFFLDSFEKIEELRKYKIYEPDKK